MKKILLIALLLAAIAPAFAFEYTYEGNTLEYTILTGNTVSVQKGTAKLKGTVKIPAQVIDPNTSTVYNVTSVADEGFRHDEADRYTSVELPEGLQEIGGKAFVHCTNITGELTLPSTLKQIGSRAFYNCQNISNLIITSPNPPALVTRYAGENAIDWFYTIGQITIPAKQGVKYRHSASGQWAASVIARTDKNAPVIDPAESLVENIYYRLEAEKAIVSGVSYTNNFALNIPTNVNVEGVNYPVKAIADSAFLNNELLSSLQIPEGITHIGEKSFCKVGNLTGDVILPQSLEKIDYRAFFSSNKINNFAIKAPNVRVEKEVFQHTTFPLYVHADDYDYYMANWTEWTSRIKDCLTIYHNGTHNPGDGVYEANNVGIVPSITYKRTFTAGTWETLYLPFPVEKVTIEDDDEPNGYWSPNPWNITDGGDYYLATPASTTAANGELLFDMTTDLKEGTPYIIQFPGQYAGYYNGREVTFHGPSDWYELGNTSFAPVTPTSQMKMAGNTTLQKQTISDEVYVLRATDDFMLQHSATTLHPFECYVMPQQTNGVARAPKMTVRLRGKNDVTTSISSANAANPINYVIDGNNLTVYANGQSVQIYSINGILLHSISVGEDMAQVLLDKGCYIIYSNGNSQKVIL